MDDLNVFLTLTPSDRWGLAADVFRLPHNIARYVKPAAIIDDGPSRETTPSESIYDETPVDDLEYFHRIQLRFDQDTKVKGRITFGSDPDRCDVLLASKRGQHKISGRHFYISFDDHERPVIRDISTNGLTVSYDGQAKNERRNHFQWIIFPGFETITTILRKDGLAFDIHLPKHYETHQNEYEDNVKMFMAGAPPEHELAFDSLVLRSQGTSFAPSESLSPTKRPIYLKRRELGRGAYGRVRMVVNASTGAEYAGKEFFHKKGWEKEIEIMRILYHHHVVQFVDFRTAPQPLLVMEYLPLGNLEAQHEVLPISDQEMMVVFNQVLEGLTCLHGENITHRDLKPENILLRSRTPIHIKLADFGLSQDKTDLKTFCGSPRYAAPEIFLGSPYTNTVDMWSLAVIVMQFIYGLPQYEQVENAEQKENPNKQKGNVRQKENTQQEKQAKQKENLQLYGQFWCQQLIVKANDWDSDPLIDFLTEHMLKWKPQARLSASECLRTASTIGLFDGTFSQTGNATPRLQPDGGADSIDPEEASTIMGPLWRGVSMSLRDEGRILRSEGPSRIREWAQAVDPSLARNESTTDDEIREGYDTRSAKRRRSTNNADPADLQQPPTERSLRWHNSGANSQINEIKGMNDSEIDPLLHPPRSSLRFMTPSHSLLKEHPSQASRPVMANTKVHGYDEEIMNFNETERNAAKCLIEFGQREQSSYNIHRDLSDQPTEAELSQRRADVPPIYHLPDFYVADLNEGFVTAAPIDNPIPPSDGLLRLISQAHHTFDIQPLPHLSVNGTDSLNVAAKGALLLPQTDQHTGGQALRSGAKYIPLQIQTYTIYVRKQDCWTCATHIRRAAGRRPEDLRRLLAVHDIPTDLVKGSGPWDGIYVPIDAAFQIAKFYGLNSTAESLKAYHPEAAVPADRLEMREGHDKGRRRTRDEEREILEEAYQKNHNSTEGDLKDMVSQLDMGIGQVRVRKSHTFRGSVQAETLQKWFQNRRQKDRKDDNRTSCTKLNFPIKPPEEEEKARQNYFPKSDPNNLASTDQPDRHSLQLPETRYEEHSKIAVMSPVKSKEVKRTVQGSPWPSDISSEGHDEAWMPSPAQHAPTPTLPHLSVNSIDELSMTGKTDYAWPQLNSGNDDRTSLNTEPAVYLGNVSQQSHLSLMHPLPETNDFSPHYGQSLDEHILDIIP